MKVFLVLATLLISVLTINGNVIEQACYVIRENEDHLPALIDCETQAYPARFNEISASCLNTTLGMTKIEHIKAVCRKDVDIYDSMRKMQTCLMEHIREITEMTSDIMNGFMNAQQCMSEIIRTRILTRRTRRDTMQASVTDAVEGLLQMSGKVIW